MSAPSGRPQHSPTGEAVEQLAGAVRVWTDALAGFAIAEANRMKTGPYGLADLVTVPVRWTGVVVGATVRTLETAPDNVSLFTRRGPGPWTVRTHVREDVVTVTPPATPVLVTVPELRGVSTGRVVEAARITVDPDVLDSGTQQCTVTVDATDLPNDVYEGPLLTPDGTPLATVRLAIDGLGTP